MHAPTDDHTCAGEDRADPDSWGDPDIVTEPWAAPPEVEPSDEPATSGSA